MDPRSQPIWLSVSLSLPLKSQKSLPGAGMKAVARCFIAEVALFCILELATSTALSTCGLSPFHQVREATAPWIKGPRPQTRVSMTSVWDDAPEYRLLLVVNQDGQPSSSRRAWIYLVPTLPEVCSGAARSWPERARCSGLTRVRELVSRGLSTQWSQQRRPVWGSSADGV